MENALMAATSAENTETRIAKSNLSREVMCVSGVDFWPIAACKRDRIDGDDVREPEYEGGVGGASRTSKVIGTTAVDMMPKARIDVRVFEKLGDKSCPNPPPIGFAIDMIIVAVVRPFKSNHLSEYFGAKIWYTGAEKAARPWPMMMRV
jgi:hypothetical protein